MGSKTQRTMLTGCYYYAANVVNGDYQPSCMQIDTLYQGLGLDFATLAVTFTGERSKHRVQAQHRPCTVEPSTRSGRAGKRAPWHCTVPPFKRVTNATLL